MIFEKLFRKKTQSAEAETELQALKEKMQQEENAKFNRRMLAGFDDNLATRKEQIRAQKIEKLFPRTMDQIAEVENGKVNREKAFAMDGMEERFFSPPKMTLDNEVLDRMTDYFIGWQSCAILKQNWLIDRACTIPAEDAIAPGWKLAFSDADQTEELSEADEKARAAKLKEIEASAKDYGIANVCKKAETLKKVFGYCLVIPQIDGADMSKPFNIESIRPNSYKGFSVIEPMWIVPQFDAEARNPSSPDFYIPTEYVIAGNTSHPIHKSWLVKLVNSPVPDVLKPVYYWGGVPLTQQIFRRVYAAETTANEAPNLAMTKRILVLEGNLENAIFDPQLFQSRMEMFSRMRDNFGVAVVEPSSNAKQIDTSLADFEELIMTQYQLVASIAQIPISKLLKVQIKGFNSTGEFEKKDYTQTLIAIQENDYTPIIELHNKLFTMSKYGEEIRLSVNWNKVDEPTEKENAEILHLKAQRDAAYITAGVVTSDEVRDRLRNDEEGEFTAIPAVKPMDDLYDGLDFPDEEETADPEQDKQ